MARCKVCEAEIKFIRTQKNQRQMPVDLPAITVVTDQGQVIKAYTPHWATCKSAETFRKGGTSNESL
jgi:hypothetical protein